MSQQLKIIISSTARDLPEHRKEVMDACLRQGMFPDMMEHLPASDMEAISASLKMVNDADVYVLILAHRYGYVPEGHTLSVTEMEYNRAVERKIRRLVFVMHDEHPIKASNVEKGEGAIRLDAFKSRVQAENIVNFFKSPADLRAHVIDSLSNLREPDLTKFHYVSDIPAPPEGFIAHPYTLLQTHQLVGRQPELNLLTDWVAKSDSEIYKARILNIVAIGGLGKSALTWKWFNDIAPQEMKPLAGRMWWSFYESDATFENFVIRALAYVTRRTLDEVQKIPAPERERQLLAALDREPFLVVLDGLERILIAYPRMDAAHLQDSQVENNKTLRQTADPRDGRFLKKLSQVKNSRILVSTRLYPAALETDGGEPIPSSYRHPIEGLSDEDAVELWRAFEVSGSRDELLSVFTTFGKHPLLIQALVGEVKRYHRAPGNFQEWLKSNIQFDPAKFPRLQEAMAHVMEFALRELDDKSRQALQIISAFRMPARYDTLAALLIGEGKACADEHELDEVLTELEDRGLVGWDKRANRYDLHPIVRGVVWSDLGDGARRNVYMNLHAHFEALPMIDDYLKVNSLEDLTPAIELYNTLIELGRYDDAAVVFRDRLSKATFYRLSANRQMVELLEMLFPDGFNQLPRLSEPAAQAYTFALLALGYNLSGQPGRAVSLYRRNITIHSEMNDNDNLKISLGNLSNGLQLSGALYESEITGYFALAIARGQDDRFWEATNLTHLGLRLAVRGILNKSKAAFQRALRIFIEQSQRQLEGVVNSCLAQGSLWLSEFGDALSFANRAWEMAPILNLEADFIRAAGRQGEAALGLDDFTTADEWLNHALTRARIVNMVEEELSALVALAELRRRQGDLKAARAFLYDVWDSAERGPYPLIHADACNVLAQIEREEGNQAKAVDAATRAYQLAWCNGPPFAYHWGLEKARKHLRELGAKEPEMPPFDESKFEPMPEVEIDPEDEFHAGKSVDS